MNNITIFVTMLAIMVLAFVASAQSGATTDLSGKWILNIPKSKLSDREKRIFESQMLIITQTSADLKLEPSTKLIGGGQFGGDVSMTIPLGGKKTEEMPGGPLGASPVTLSSKWEGSKLVLSIVRTITGMIEGHSSVKETYELSADGKSLTVQRETFSSMSPDVTRTVRVYTRGS